MIPRVFSILALSLLGVVAAEPGISVYPDGETAYNPRIPCVVPAAGGAKGKQLPVSALFSYELSPFITFPQGGKLAFFLRDAPRRAPKDAVTLSDGVRKLCLRVDAASAGRGLLLGWSQDEKAPLFIPGGALATGWRQIVLTWTATEAVCSVDGKEVARLPLGSPFSPRKLSVVPDLIDEVTLEGDGALRLDWETDYAAAITSGTAGGKTTARLFGFDSFVVSAQPNRRDTPMIQLLNGAAQAREVSFHFEATGEVTKVKQEWDQKITVEAGKSSWTPIVFPFALGNDVYHLTATAKGLSGDYKETKHFLHVTPRNEPAGPAKFALHDTDRAIFGSWPDALPIGISHLYVRWANVQGPPWIKDNKGSFGLDPETPSAEWNWDPRIDWAIAQGLTPYISVMSTPSLPWMREREYTEPGAMSKTTWDANGGFPNMAFYRRFMRTWAERYAGKIAWYEVENEPYYIHHTGKPPVDYVQIARAMYEEVHAADPKAKVVANVDSAAHLPWTNDVFSNGITQWVQGISVHTYTTPRLPDQANLPAALEELRKIMAKTGQPLTLLNSETGVYTALREDVDKPISPERLAELIKAGTPNIVVSTGWPHYALDERTAGISMVRNIIYNFAAGSELFTFFGWNPDWPPKDWWTKPKPRGADGCFAVISAAKDGTRTPSQFTLAIAVATAQLEGTLNGKTRTIDQGGIAGATFTKKNGGEVMTLWSGMGKRSLLVQSTDPDIEIVSLLGTSRRAKASGSGPYLHALELDDSPVYIHSAHPGLVVLPSPIIEAGQVGQDSDRLRARFTLVNRSDKPWKGTVTLSDSEGWTVTPAAPAYDLKPKGRTVIEIACAVPPGAKPGAHSLEAAMILPDGNRFVFPLPLVVRPSVTVPFVPEGTAAANLASTGDALRLDRPEQVTVGRPPQMVSLQEEKYWKGPAELSGAVNAGATARGLLVRVQVRDSAPQLPAPWPGVKGSCVELFFDFRSPSIRAARSAYEKGVYQIVLKPALKAGENVEIWNASERSGKISGVTASGARIDALNYWVAVEIPWSAVEIVPQPGTSFGFDVAIDGPGLQPGDRKSQLILFGDSTNSVDASKFGLLILSRTK